MRAFFPRVVCTSSSLLRYGTAFGTQANERPDFVVSLGNEEHGNEGVSGSSLEEGLGQKGGE
jgi:hypothetical protein